MPKIMISPGENIQAAVNNHPPATIFQLSAGVYRNQEIQAKSGDQFIGDPGGGTILSGAIVLREWTASGRYWVHKELPASPSGHGTAGRNPLARDLNDLFVDNQLYTRVGSKHQVTAGKWYFDASTHAAYISDNPIGYTIEYSVTANLSYDNGATGVLVKDLTISKYATDAQLGPIHAVRDWRIVNVTSTQNHGSGLNIGSGTVVEGGHYIFNGQIGINGSEAKDAQVLGAEIAYNNYAGYDSEWEAGGLKIGLSSDILISGNHVHDNYGHGLWSDVGDANFTYTHNVVDHNDGNGIMYEISYGTTIIRDNVVGCNSGAQIYISNSQGVEVAHNAITVGASNSGIAGGITMIYVDRGSGVNGPFDTKNNNIHDNSITHLGGGANGFWIYHNLAAARGWANGWDNNSYYIFDTEMPHWHFGQNDYGWQAFIDHTGQEPHGLMITPSNPAAVDCYLAKYGMVGESGITGAILLGAALSVIRNYFG